MTKHKDIYGTEYTIQTTASDYFRLDLRKPAHPDSKCLSLDYDMSLDLYHQLQEYLSQRNLLPSKKE